MTWVPSFFSLHKHKIHTWRRFLFITSPQVIQALHLVFLFVYPLSSDPPLNLLVVSVNSSVNLLVAVCASFSVEWCAHGTYIGRLALKPVFGYQVIFSLYFWGPCDFIKQGHLEALGSLLKGRVKLLLLLPFGLPYHNASRWFWTKAGSQPAEFWTK